jgi:hypothetical protein
LESAALSRRTREAVIVDRGHGLPMRQSLFGLRPLDSLRGVSRGKSLLDGGKTRRNIRSPD